MIGPKQIILTSFRDRQHWQGTPFSVARWSPPELRSLPKIWFLAPIFNGIPMRHLEPGDFREKYEQILMDNGDGMEKFLHTWSSYTLTLLCWCNPDRQKGYSKLYCHRILIGYYIEEYYPNIPVIYLDGADKPVWERKK